MKFENYLYIILSFLILATAVWFVSRWTYNCPSVDIPSNDSTITSTDTLYFPGEMIIDTVYFPTEPAITPSPDIKTAFFDTVAILGRDTALVTNMVKYNLNKDLFDLVQIIAMRTYTEQITQIDTIYQTELQPVEIPADAPFYDKFWFGSGIGILVSLIAILIFGG